MAQLAIKGHTTRGEEVIQLLEMLGGKNIYKLDGKKDLWYILSNSTIEHATYLFEERGFTLEEFEEKFPYKVGDKVKCWINGYCSINNIKDIQWDGIVNEIKYRIQDYWYSTINLQPYKEETMKEIKSIDLNKLEQQLDEALAKETPESLNKWLDEEPEPKKPTYPKDYKECCEVIGYRLCGTTIIGYKTNVLKTLQKLLICRDAYWKIAGKQLGLDKPWKYDMSKDEFVYAIVYQYGYIEKCEVRYKNHILAFPTLEMRNAFYENFRELIEECKELL